MFDLYLRKLAVEIEQLNNAECINLFSQKLFFKLDLATERFCVLRSQFKSDSKEAKEQVMPKVVDIFAKEKKWDTKRKEQELKEAIEGLQYMK